VVALTPTRCLLVIWQDHAGSHGKMKLVCLLAWLASQ
jgi:hypothetical protein